MFYIPGPQVIYPSVGIEAALGETQTPTRPGSQWGMCVKQQLHQFQRELPKPPFFVSRPGEVMFLKGTWICLFPSQLIPCQPFLCLDKGHHLMEWDRAEGQSQMAASLSPSLRLKRTDPAAEERARGPPPGQSLTMADPHPSHTVTRSSRDKTGALPPKEQARRLPFCCSVSKQVSTVDSSPSLASLSDISLDFNIVKALITG